MKVICTRQIPAASTKEERRYANGSLNKIRKKEGVLPMISDNNSNKESEVDSIGLIYNKKITIF